MTKLTDLHVLIDPPLGRKLHLEPQTASWTPNQSVAIMSDEEDVPELSSEDLKFFKKRSMAASFLMAGPGEMPRRDVSEKRKRKLERKEREAAGEAEEPRQSKAWNDAQTLERRTGLPVKLADGTMKKMLRDTALPEVDPEAEHAAPLSDRQRKKVRMENNIARGKTAEQLAKEEEASAAAEEQRAAELVVEQEKQQAELAKKAELSPAAKKMALAELSMSVMRDPQVTCRSKMHSADKQAGGCVPEDVRMAAGWLSDGWSIATRLGGRLVGLLGG